MSLIGKFFVVMQILLSVTFMGFAVAVFSYQTDWKTRHDAEQKQKVQAQSNLANLQSEFEKYRLDMTNEVKSQQDKAEKAEADRVAVQRQLDDQRTVNTRLTNDLESQTTLAETTEDEAKARTSEAMAQRTVNLDLHGKLKASQEKLVAAEDSIYNLNIERTNLISKNKSLVEEVSFLKKVVRTHNLETDPRVYAAQTDPPPVMEGLVLNAAENKRGSVDLVEISLGSDDGLVKGHKLFVYRSGLQPGEDPKYLGQIELVYVDSDQAVGMVIEKAKNGIIKKGDNVTSKL